jgi:glycine hydroxymethyltransferase
MNPGGVRIGTPALTSRKFKETDFIIVGELLHRACLLSLEIQKNSNSKLLKDFVLEIEKNEEVKNLRNVVKSFAEKFPMPL